MGRPYSQQEKGDFTLLFLVEDKRSTGQKCGQGSPCFVRRKASLHGSIVEGWRIDQNMSLHAGRALARC